MDGRLQRLNIELHALHAPDAHDGAHGDRLAGLAARGPRLAADIDGNGKVTANDARMILRISAKIENPDAVNRTSAEN